MQDKSMKICEAEDKKEISNGAQAKKNSDMNRAVFSLKTVETKKQQNNNSEVLKRKKMCQPKILYLTKISLKNEDKIIDIFIHVKLKIQNLEQRDKKFPQVDGKINPNETSDLQGKIKSTKRYIKVFFC